MVIENQWLALAAHFETAVTKKICLALYFGHISYII